MLRFLKVFFDIIELAKCGANKGSLDGTVCKWPRSHIDLFVSSVNEHGQIYNDSWTANGVGIWKKKQF